MLPSEQATKHRTMAPIRINSAGYVEDKPLSQGMVEHLRANANDVIREVREHDKNGTVLAERCECCGYRHGIGANCLKPRHFAPGVSADDRAAVPFIGVGSAEKSRKRQQAKDRARWAEIAATRKHYGYTVNRHGRPR